MGLETRLQAVSKAATWLTGRLDGMREKVEASERKLQAYREAEGLVDMQGTLDLVDKQLPALPIAWSRHARSATISRGSPTRSSGPVSSPAPSWRPIRHWPGMPRIQALKASELQAEREVSELAKRYGPAHPKMLAARSDLDTVRAKLATEVGNVMAGVRKELDIARAQAEKLEAELAATKIHGPGYQSPGVHAASPEARRGVGSPALRSVPDAFQRDQPRCGRRVYQCPHHRCRRGSRRRRSSPTDPAHHGHCRPCWRSWSGSDWRC